jgi:hypothetical protein
MLTTHQSKDTDWLTRLKKKKNLRPNYYLPTKNLSHWQRGTQSESQRIENYTLRKWTQKQARVAMLTYGTVDFNLKLVRRYKVD